MNKQIYLAGAITGLDWYAAEGWRIKVKTWIEHYSNWIAVNPCQHIPKTTEFTDRTEIECMMWDLWKLKQCDIVVCDFSHPESIGTTWELATAWECKIPIIGVKIDDSKTPVHPWWQTAAMHVCENLDELKQYLTKHFLIGD